MTLSAFITAIENLVKDVGHPLASTFIHGWLSTINEPFNTYDVFMLLPPMLVDNNPRKRDWREYRITIYLFRQDMNTVTKVRMTPTERDAAWTALLASMSYFVDQINASPNDYQISSPVTMELDEGHIGNDDTIWVKTTMNMNVNNC